jgi:hypothetical protein
MSILSRLMLAAFAMLAFQATNAPAQHAKPGDPPVSPIHKDHGDHATTGTEARDLGTTTVGTLTIHASLESPLDAGQPAIFHIGVKPADPKPTAVRCWIGNASGTGGIKAKAELEDPKEGMYHGETEVPWKLEGDRYLWIEVQTSASQRTRVSFPLKAEEKKS